jgi:hypothetical protein
MRRFITAMGLLGALSLLSGCGKREGGGGADVMGSKGSVVYATTECTQGNADGVRCDKKTCKTDAKSDCNDFASKCIYYGHQYNGTRTEGTCTRIAQ